MCITNLADKKPARQTEAHNQIQINGLDIYYEIHGSGRPLVLLHGALSTIDTSFAKVIPSLSQTHQVIAMEQQAHGRRLDLDRPLSYEQMADDMAALLSKLEIENADILGYSMGGGIVLQLSIRHPQLVNRLVTISTTYNKDGMNPDMIAGI